MPRITVCYYAVATVTLLLISTPGRTAPAPRSKQCCTRWPAVRFGGLMTSDSGEAYDETCPYD